MFETSTSSSAPTAATSTNELEYAGFKQVFTVVDGLKLCSYTNLHSCSGLDEDRGKQGEGRTILVLLHGYPQS